VLINTFIESTAKTGTVQCPESPVTLRLIDLNTAAVCVFTVDIH
jgi:hypothetical protein